MILIRKWLKEQKRIRDERRYEKAKHILAEMVNRKDPEIYKQLRAIAKSMAMRELDSIRIHHCFVCPRTGPLKKFKDSYFCEEHVNQREAVNAA